MRLFLVTLVVPDYDTAIAWFVDQLGFVLVEDADLGGGKRWVRVAASADAQTSILIAKAATASQHAAIGAQTGGRVGWFLQVEDFPSAHARMSAAGVRFVETPRRESYGWVAVFVDPWGNRWDLLGPAAANPP
jgi:catechol 2,3-dioxygenase-like lactoylglutathione lyase family enzyme